MASYPLFSAAVLMNKGYLALEPATHCSAADFHKNGPDCGCWWGADGGRTVIRCRRSGPADLMNDRSDASVDLSTDQTPLVT